jgi:hypothetical protein
MSEMGNFTVLPAIPRNTQESLELVLSSYAIFKLMLQEQPGFELDKSFRIRDM